MGLIKRLFNREPMLEREIEKWLDKSLEAKLPSEVIAINFNLYEDGEDNWTIEMIGASEFDENDDDWACNEVYNNREKAFSWKERESWKTIQSEIEAILNQYLQSGKNAEILKRYVGVGVGFVDGSINVLYKR